MQKRESARVAGFLAALCAGVLLVAYAGTRMDRRPQSSGTATQLVYLPRAEFLRPVSLGYHTVLADLVWFRTISYFGEHYRSDHLYPWLAYMCDLVTDLDPRADYVYRFAGMVLPWEAHQADQGIRLLEKGVRELPDSWVLHYWLGFNYYLFRNDYERAADQLQRAARLPGADPNAARLAAVLYRRQHGPEMALQFLADMGKTADSATVREVLHNQLREAKLAADLDRLAAAVRIYRERYGEVPRSLSQLVDAGLLTGIPSDPFGGTYQIAPDATVRSSTGHPPLQLYRSQAAEALLRDAQQSD